MALDGLSETRAVKWLSYALLHRVPELGELTVIAARRCGLDLELLFRRAMPAEPTADALELVGRLGCLDLAIEMMSHSSEKVRTAAIVALKRLEDPEAIPALEHTRRFGAPGSVRLLAGSVATDLRASSRRSRSRVSDRQTKSPRPNEPTARLIGALAVDDEIPEGEIPLLVDLLKHEAGDVRHRAASALAKRGDTSAGLLFEALRSSSLSVNDAVLGLLGDLRDPRGVEFIPPPSRYGSTAEIEALAKIGDAKAIARLIALAQKGERDWSRAAGEALARIGEPAAAALKRLYIENPSFRRHQGDLLGRVAGASAIDLLLSSLQSRYREVRESAEKGLRLVGTEALEPTLTLLDGKLDSSVLAHVAGVLGEMKEPRALEGIGRVLRDGDAAARAKAVEALSGFSGPRCLELLASAAEARDQHTRRGVAKALGSVEDEGVWDLLFRLLRDPAPKVRAEGILSVGVRLSWRARAREEVERQAIEILLERLFDSEPQVSSQARSTLIHLSHRSSIVERITRAAEEATPATSEALQSLTREMRRERDWAAREDSTFAMDLPAPKEDPSPDATPRPISDDVFFSVTAPLEVAPRASFVLDLWAHEERQRDNVLARARDTQRDAKLRLRSTGPVPIARGAKLLAHLSLPTLGLAGVERIIYWTGRVGNASFPVTVPDDAAEGFHLGAIVVSLGPVRVITLDFEINVGRMQGPTVDVTGRETRIRSAFASYAREDLRPVLARVQGMQKLLPDLDIFLDVVSLRSGEDWEQRVIEEVAWRERFYLFWSRSARSSRWVEREWRIAVEKKGIASIDPVPLEPSRVAPPPPELEHLHFDEWMLVY